MKIPRSTSAMMMPTMSTSCWYFLGTLNRLMMMTNTNRLSMLRLYSVSHPARNWPACSPPATNSMMTANTSASPT